MNKLTLTVSTKAGDKQSLRFGAVQSIPYPCISAECGTFKWTHTGGMFGQFGNAATGIGTEIVFHLLTPTATHMDSRTEFAGYIPYGSPSTAPAPGTLKFRGQDLGEMTITLSRSFGQWHAQITNEGPLTPTARDFIKREIVPALEAYAMKNGAVLKDEAVTKIKARMASEITKARAALDTLVQIASTAKY